MWLLHLIDKLRNYALRVFMLWSSNVMMIHEFIMLTTYAFPFYSKWCFTLVNGMNSIKISFFHLLWVYLWLSYLVYFFVLTHIFVQFPKCKVLFSRFFPFIKTMRNTWKFFQQSCKKFRWRKTHQIVWRVSGFLVEQKVLAHNLKKHKTSRWY